MAKNEIKEITDLPGIGPATAEKLKEAGFTDLMAIAVASPGQLIGASDLPQALAIKIINVARNSLKMSFITASEVLEKRKEVIKLNTGSKQFNALLGGGIESGATTETYGAYGSSKTQMAHQLSVTVQLPKDKGGMEGKAVFIDSLLYHQPILIKKDGLVKIIKIGEFLDKFYEKDEELSKEIENVEVPAFDNNNNITWKKVNRIYRHKNDDKKYRVMLKNGLCIDITSAHTLFKAIIDSKSKIRKIEEVQTSNLKIGDYLVCPHNIKDTQNIYNILHVFDILKTNNVRGIKEKSIDKKNRSKLKDNEFLLSTHAFPKKIVIDSNFAKFMGWYLAEGHTNHSKTSGSKLVFTLNTKTAVDGINLCKQICKRLNLKYYVNDRGSNVQMSIYSTPLVLLFDILFGKGALNKRVPSIIFNISKNLKEQFIDAWISGDAGSSARKDLISDINYLGLFVGRRYSIYRLKRKGKYRLKRKGKLIKIENRTIIAKNDIFQCYGGNKKGRIRQITKGDLAFIKIKLIKEIRYKKKYVYDICVDKYNNFIGGYGGIFVHNTENTFRPERIIQICKRYGLKQDQTLKNIIVARAYNSDHQMLLAEKVEELIKKGENIKLIVVDSLTAHFRAEFVGRGTLADRQQKLNKHMHTLTKLADLNNAVVYVTNQVMARPDMFFGDPTEAIGGHIVAHNSTFRIYLRRGKKNTRVAKLVDSPSLPEAEIPFKITEQGIEDV